MAFFRVALVALARAAARATPAAARRAVSYDLSSLRGRHLQSGFDLTADETRGLVRLASALKAKLRGTGVRYQPLVRAPRAAFATAGGAGAR